MGKKSIGGFCLEILAHNSMSYLSVNWSVGLSVHQSVNPLVAKPFYVSTDPAQSHATVSLN